MKKSQKIKSIAQRQRWLYAYAAINIFAMIYSYFTVLHSPLPAPMQSPYFNTSEMHAFEIQSIIFGAAIEVAAMTYLLTAKKIKHVLIFLYILLAFNILALPAIFFFKPTLLRSVLSIVQLCFTAAMVKLLQSIKRDDAKCAKAMKSKAKSATAAEPEGSKGWRVTRKVIRVLFRINSVFYGIYLIWAGALLLQFEHDRLTIERIFIPFAVLGILYVFPYYLLKGKKLAAYVGSIVLFTALTVLSLHIPVHVGRAAPAYLPAPPPQYLFAIIAWMFFHLSPAFVVYGVLICFDATSKWTKQIARIDEDRRAAVTLFWVLVLAGSLFLASMVRTHTATHPVAAAPTKLVTFTSSKYKFKIGFPYTPSATDATEQADSGNSPVPYTQYDAYITNNSGLEQTYNVYAYNWPAADGSFVGLDQPTLKSTLEGFVNNRISTDQGTLVKMKTIPYDSGKKLAVEAQYTVNHQYYGNVTIYLRVVVNGTYEYDIQTWGLSHSDFDTFANSFQFIGPITTDVSDSSADNITSGSPDNISIGNTAGQPSNVPNNGSVSRSPPGQQPTNGTASNAPTGMPDNGTVSNMPPDSSTIQLQ